ncbi:hypothetical protein [Pedobacter sp. L105]|nr:hypothetical protein [Pedobacter sp. L105]
MIDQRYFIYALTGGQAIVMFYKGQSDEIPDEVKKENPVKAMLMMRNTPA